MTKRTIEQQINEANQRLAGLKARQKAHDARIHMILGKTLLALAENEPIHATALLSLLSHADLKPAEERDLQATIEDLRERSASERSLTKEDKT